MFLIFPLPRMLPDFPKILSSTLSVATLNSDSPMIDVTVSAYAAYWTFSIVAVGS
jgi:hypothetical protein